MADAILKLLLEGMAKINTFQMTVIIKMMNNIRIQPIITVKPTQTIIMMKITMEMIIIMTGIILIIVIIFQDTILRTDFLLAHCIILFGMTTMVTAVITTCRRDIGTEIILIGTDITIITLIIITIIGVDIIPTTNTGLIL